jgi:hypothetical protein
MGRALANDKKFRWPWQGNEEEREEVRLAWGQHDVAFEALYEHVEAEVRAAYKQGYDDGAAS